MGVVKLSNNAEPSDGAARAPWKERQCRVTESQSAVERGVRRLSGVLRRLRTLSAGKWLPQSRAQSESDEGVGGVQERKDQTTACDRLGTWSLLVEGCVSGMGERMVIGDDGSGSEMQSQLWW